MKKQKGISGSATPATPSAKHKTGAEILRDTKRKIAERESKKAKSSDVGKQAVLSAASYQIVDEWSARRQEQQATYQGWGQRLVALRSSMKGLNEKYRELLFKLLERAYAVYIEASSSKNEETFFDFLRQHLRLSGVPVQKNTTDAALVIRFVCGDTVSPKTVYDWSTALNQGQAEKIEADKFADWLTKKTLTTVIADHKALVKGSETREERMRRARVVMLRLIEARETKPVVSFKTTVKDAEGQISKSGLWLGIGNATRRMDRGSFYADVNICMVLPPDIDTEIYILNQQARIIEPVLERYEAGIDDYENTLWADELWEQLVSAGEEESARIAEKWRTKQQAAVKESRDRDKKPANNSKPSRGRKS